MIAVRGERYETMSLATNSLLGMREGYARNPLAKFVAALFTMSIFFAASNAQAEELEPDLFRGQIATVDATSIMVKTKDGTSVSLGFSENTAVFALSEGSFTKVDFGVYVGAVGVKLPEYSPIIRDSLSWLHKGFELRIIDEDLRGIASGHRKWALTPDTIIAHGWVDDMEGRVLSIKYGPTEQEETDVEIGRDVPVLRMSRSDRAQIQPKVNVTVGALKNPNGKYDAVYVFVGKDGIVPPL